MSCGFMRQYLGQIAHVEIGPADRAIAEMTGLGFGDAVRIETGIPRKLRQRSTSYSKATPSNIPTSRTYQEDNDAPRKSSRRFTSWLGVSMNQVLDPSDECPHCRLPLEILSVKLGLRGTAMVYACMNCAMARTENPKQQVLSASFRRAPG
jgi:hypothetical protein